MTRSTTLSPPLEQRLPARVAAAVLIAASAVFAVIGLVAALTAHSSPLLVSNHQVYGVLPYIVAGAGFLLSVLSLLGLLLLLGVAELLQVVLVQLQDPPASSDDPA